MPRRREFDIGIFLRSRCPYLEDFKIIKDEKDPAYNCIAYAAGDETRWWGTTEDDYWPTGVPKKYNLASWILAFESLGYSLCVGESLEEDYDKIAIYAVDDGHGNGGRPEHVAKQAEHGLWRSKIGKLQLIEHELHALKEPYYGQVVKIMRKSKLKLGRILEKIGSIDLEVIRSEIFANLEDEEHEPQELALEESPFEQYKNSGRGAYVQLSNIENRQGKNEFTYLPLENAGSYFLKAWIIRQEEFTTKSIQPMLDIIGSYNPLSEAVVIFISRTHPDKWNLQPKMLNFEDWQKIVKP